MTCRACQPLAAVNRDLSHEVERLAGQAASLLRENDRLRAELAACGNGRLIPRGATVIVRPDLAKIDDREWEERNRRSIGPTWKPRQLIGTATSDSAPGAVITVRAITATPPPAPIDGRRARRGMQVPSLQGPRPSIAREAMITYLREHGPSTIENLRLEAGVSAQAIRQQVRRWRDLFAYRKDPNGHGKTAGRLLVHLLRTTA